MKKIIGLATLLSIVFCYSCSPMLQYNKVYLSDEDMIIGEKSIQSTETSSATYREGAAGANGGNTGGGCGCN